MLSSGIIIIPSPIIFPAKASSGVSSIRVAIPLTGLENLAISLKFEFSLVSFLLSFSLTSVLEIGVFLVSSMLGAVKR